MLIGREGIRGETVEQISEDCIVILGKEKAL